MNKSRILVWTLILLLVAGCSQQVLVTTYYLLDYRPTVANPKLMLDKPLPFTAQVRNFNIPRSFDSIRIIARFSTHQINYYRYSLWAVRPQIAVADLLVQHINSYGIFTSCQREFLDERPDLEITGEIFQIEKYESEKYAAAHLKMVFELYDREKNKRLVTHAVDDETPIPPDNMTIFAKALSDIINMEAEVFLEKIVDHFQPVKKDSSKVERKK